MWKKLLNFSLFFSCLQPGISNNMISRARVIYSLWKIYKSLLTPNCTQMTWQKQHRKSRETKFWQCMLFVICTCFTTLHSYYNFALVLHKKCSCFSWSEEHNFFHSIYCYTHWWWCKGGSWSHFMHGLYEKLMYHMCKLGKTSNYSFCVQGFRLIKCSFHKLADKFAVHVHTRLSVKFMHEPFSTLIN